MSPSEAIEEALHAASRFVLDHFACPEGNWYDGEAQLLNKKLRDALAALNEVAVSGLTEEERAEVSESLTLAQDTLLDHFVSVNEDGVRVWNLHAMKSVYDAIGGAQEALSPTPSLSGLTEEERAEGRRLLAQIEGSKTCADWGAEGDATRALERWMVKHAEALLSPALRTQIAGEGWLALKAAAEELVRKVECGEMRSKRSYAAFKAALALLPAPPAPAETDTLANQETTP